MTKTLYTIQMGKVRGGGAGGGGDDDILINLMNTKFIHL